MRAIRTLLWRPGDDYLSIIAEAIAEEVKDGDLVVVSEKAIAMAKGRIVNEESFRHGLSAKLITSLWTKYVWGYFLGPLCHLRPKTIQRLRSYPQREGGAHKQVVLVYAGFLQALGLWSEGGIDVTNLPFAYACLPLEDPQEEARKIRLRIRNSLGKKVGVMIVDTDKTYSWHNLHITPRPSPMKGIVSKGDFLTYVLCRALRLKARATPLALVGFNMSINEALDLAELAHKARGSGAGMTVWDMAERFGVRLTHTTWEMLEKVEHKPIVLISREGVTSQ